MGLHRTEFDLVIRPHCRSPNSFPKKVGSSVMSGIMSSNGGTSILSSMKLQFSEISGSISWIFQTFSTFSKILFLTTADHSQVLNIIRFSLRLCVERTIWGRCGVLWENYHVFHRFYGGCNLRRFSQNQINLHLKASQNHRTVLNSNRAQFHEKPPAHFAATYAIIFFYQNF